jgi:hypothetical protein
MTRHEFEAKLLEIYQIGVDAGLATQVFCTSIPEDRPELFEVMQDMKNKATGLIQQTCQEVFPNG